MSDPADRSKRAHGPEEAARRAEIIQRYLSLDRPSAHDDEQFAAELGVSRDLLYRLAASWRRHADPGALHGARTLVTEADREAALRAAADPDLTGVDPTKRAETLRRISVVRDYLALDAPTRIDLDAAAQSLGMKQNSFQRLLRSWLLHRSAAALPGAARPMRTPQRRKPGIPREVDAVITEAISTLGVEATSMQLHRFVRAACREKGLKPPAQTSTYYRLMKARSLQADQSEPAISVDHSAINLAIAGPEGAQVPVLSLAFSRPDGRVLAHLLSLDPPTPGSTARLLARLLEASDADEIGDRVPLEIRADPAPGWDELLDALVQGGVELKLDEARPLKLGSVLGRALGDVLGNLRFRPGLTRNPRKGASTRIIRPDRPLSFQEAQAAVADAVAMHNAGRSGPAPQLVASRLRAELRITLDHLAGSTLGRE